MMKVAVAAFRALSSDRPYVCNAKANKLTSAWHDC